MPRQNVFDNSLYKFKINLSICNKMTILRSSCSSFKTRSQITPCSIFWHRSVVLRETKKTFCRRLKDCPTWWLLTFIQLIASTSMCYLYMLLPFVEWSKVKLLFAMLEFIKLVMNHNSLRSLQPCLQQLQREIIYQQSQYLSQSGKQECFYTMTRLLKFRW